MYKIGVAFIYLLAMLNFIIFQTQMSLVFSMIMVLGAVGYGMYKTPREKRMSTLLFILVAIPVVMVLQTYVR